MKVYIKDLAVNMEIKNRGIEVGIYDTQDNFLGDLVIRKSGLIWCRGRTTPDNGKRISWERFIELMDNR